MYITRLAGRFFGRLKCSIYYAITIIIILNMVKKTTYKAMIAKHEVLRLNRAKLLAAGIVRRDKSFHCQRCDLVISSTRTAHALRHTLSKGHICCDLRISHQAL